MKIPTTIIIAGWSKSHHAESQSKTECVGFEIPTTIIIAGWSSGSSSGS